MVRPITVAEILGARDYPPDRLPKAAWTRAVLEEWGVPWPPPLFWMEKLAWSGIPYREPTVDEIRADQFLRASIWTPPLPKEDPAPKPPEAQEAPPERKAEPDVQPSPPSAPPPPAPTPRAKRATKPAPPSDEPQGSLF